MQEIDYTIEQGDTLYSIARTNGMTVDQIAKLNNIDDINKIHAGETLKLKNEQYLDPYKKLLRTDEGFRNKIYKDVRGLDTVGYGHLIKPSSSRVFREMFGKDRANELLVQNKPMTIQEGDRLLTYDCKIRFDRCKKLFPNWESYSTNMKTGLFSEYYRGAMTLNKDVGSPKSIGLLNNGDVEGFLKEYPNRKDYRKYKGVKNRIDRVMHSVNAWNKRKTEIKKAERPRRPSFVSPSLEIKPQVDIE